ncbi:hypothetical protein JKG68_18160 [Microvirga aerilata]|uniref:Uncharacterized protein n=1 Tax=Microvirga aerilata TaxID=670292 RepID=A0A937D0H6_9HYPH|nr:hypothetical protein [Microvirga aerilata]MBL0405886.1 hypothetical protein [Microvirga aerilata]
MVQELILAAVGFGMGVFLIRIAMPNAQGESPRFLRGNLISDLYPLIPMMFLILGAAGLILLLS